MIQINLLPESMRKPEGTPLPRLLITYIGMAIVASTFFFYLHYKFVVVRGYERELARYEKEVQEAVEKAKRLDDLQATLESNQVFVNLVKKTYHERPVWSKILWDIKKIVNHDETQNRINPECRYLWLTSLKIGKPEKDGGARRITLEGYASALDTVIAAQMVKDLHSTMKGFRAAEPPEMGMKKEWERRLQELRNEWQTLKKEEAEESILAAKEQEMKEIEKKIQELPPKTSGMIAVRPFADFFVPRSIQMGALNWVEPGKTKEGGAEYLPQGKYKFSFDLLVKPPPAPPPEEKKKK